MNALIPHSETPEIFLLEARRRRSTLVLLFALIATVALLAAFLWPKKYAASTTVLVQENNIIKPLMEGRAVPTGNADRAVIARQVIFSHKIMEEILDQGGWMASRPSALEQDRLIEGIKQRTNVSNERENLIRIEYADTDAQRAYMVTKALAGLFIAESLAAKERESQDAYEFISKEADQYRGKLSQAEDKLAAFRAHNADARPGSATDVNTHIGELRTQIETARLDMMEQGSRERALDKELSGESQISVVQTRAMQYRSQLAELQNQLDKLLLSDTDQHPDVIRVRHQIQDLREQADDAQKSGDRRRAAGVALADDDSVRFNPVYQQLRERLAESRRNAAAAAVRKSAGEALLQQELERSRRIADSANALSQLTRDFDMYRDIYQDLLKRRENARVSMNLDADHRGLTFAIQEPPTVPLRPLGLRFMHFSMAGLGLGLALPIGLLFALLRWDSRLRSPRHLEHLTGLPVLVSMPTYVNYRDSRRTRHRDAWLVLLLIAVTIAYAVAAILRWWMLQP
jgi:polysaccharide chain length determinant protein (PEP-CTERM system associated)